MTPPEQMSSGGQNAVRPFKPRPRLFLFLLIAFALWMIALLVLYFTTVWPLHHSHSPATQSVSADFIHAPNGWR